MNFIETKILSPNQLIKLKALWNNEYPEKLYIDEMAHFEEYLKSLTEVEHILVLNSKAIILGWFFTFIRNEETWFGMILTSKVHKKGIGTELLNIAKERYLQLNGWVIDHDGDKLKSGKMYKSPLQFYLKNEFTVYNQCRLDLDKISAVKIVWNAQEQSN